MFLVYEKLDHKYGQELVGKMEEWFKKHPRRRVCYTDLFKVRRGHVLEDVMEHCKPPVVPAGQELEKGESK